MAHMIFDEDRGVVWGTTWHGLPQYIQQDGPVSYDQALEVLDYPLETIRLGFDLEGAHHQVEAFAVIRRDTNSVLVDHVGTEFTVMNNANLLNVVNDGLLKDFPELKIESVGTLRHGAVAFVNIKMDEFQVKGDTSPTVNRLMYYNPLGLGAYKVCAHSIRIVCNNTLMAAQAQGKANDSLTKISHTKFSPDRVNTKLIDLAEVMLGLTAHREQMEYLATQQVDGEYITTFLDNLFPVSDDATDAVRSRTTGRRMEVMAQFASDQGLNGIAFTRYGLLQAVTYLADHDDPRKGSDDAFVTWDGLVGARANQKQKALALLVA